MSKLLERLRACQDDRGMMADLRCILVENKKHRAWPTLYRIYVAVDDDDSAFVAGLFATHQEGDSTTVGNFGDTCKKIEQARSEEQAESNNTDTARKKNLTPTERRFLHLLSANRTELNDRVKRLVLMAKTLGIPVNYEQLLPDIKYWGDGIKTKWAATFWTQASTSFKEFREE